MANNRLSEGVGKKIVEALKKQSEIEVNPKSETETTEEIHTFEDDNLDAFSIEENEDVLDEMASSDFSDDLSISEETSAFDEEPEQISMEENVFSQPIGSQTLGSQPFGGLNKPTSSIPDNFVTELDNFEIPSNIAVLKKLITQLPSGVTRHTGAQIIRQTMEALGISMKSVLQEAQQVQEGLNNSVKECQSNIQEYKKHILTLEKQSQNHQRQYSALNELISLFIQTGR